MKKIVTGVFLTLLVYAPARALLPASEMAEKIESSKKEIENEELARRKVLSALYGINQKLRKTVSEKAKLRTERMSVENSVMKITERLKSLEDVAGQKKALLAEKLRVMHRLGGASLVRILFSATSASQLDRNIKILGIISERDRDAIRDYQRSLQEISRRHTRLAARASQLDYLEQQMKEREERFLLEQGLKNRILSGIKKKHLFALKNLHQLKEQTRRAGFEDPSLLDALLRPSFGEQRGQLIPPIKAGVLNRKYGIEKSEDSLWTISQKGIRWLAPLGTGVHAVFDGRVAWVGQIENAGHTVILDHGDHYYTVYSELDQPQVLVGQNVRKNQLIAEVGRSAIEDDPGMQFEIRHFSEPDDPQLWMKGITL